MTTKFDELVAKLKEIFQIDKPELDFGIYKIMNAKASMIQDFLNNDLKAKVQAALADKASAGKKALEEKIAKLEAQLDAVHVPHESSPDWVAAKAELDKFAAADDSESLVYAHLLTFFSRYYDDGDFISKRRYKEGQYVVPYSGEEVKLVWANQDQYYTKSGENFTNYDFKLDDGKKVHFKLVTAAVAKDNVKDNDAVRCFKLWDPANAKAVEDEEEREKLPHDILEEKDGELYIYFQYLKCKKGTKQADLLKDAVEKITAEMLGHTKDMISCAMEMQQLATKYNILAPAPTEKDKSRTVLGKHLQRYVAKNTSDYFIHKNLRKFLTWELDAYVKNEMMNLDDISNAATFDAVAANLRLIQAFRLIAMELIGFMAQLEDFQKKLWLKKKFVVQCDYCITMDRVPEDMRAEVLANERQQAEWKKWGVEVDPKTEDITAVDARMVDTKFFREEFKAKLLRAIPDLDEQCDGVLVHGENFGALQLVQKRYHEEVKCVYIDPPYNTGGDGFLYRDAFKHSSWLSMVNGRFECAKRYIAENGVIYVSIDDNEVMRLRELCDQIFGDENCLSELVWDLGTGTSAGHFTRSHEYVLAYARCRRKLSNFSGGDGVIDDRAIKKLQEKNHKFEYTFKAGTKFEAKDGVEFSGTWGGEEKTELVSGRFYCKNGQLAEDVILSACWTQKNQMDSFFAGKDTFDSKGQKVLEFYFRENGKLYCRKQREVINPPSVLRKIATTKQGSGSLKNMFSLDPNFPFPKPIELLSFLTGLLDNQILVLDYFAGSGTTAHAVIALNREDGGKRKYILVEMGEHFDTVLKPRIEKVVYSADWKDGLPVFPNQQNTGISHCFKYMTLESYEDTLNNLKLEKPGELGLLKNEYMLNYMLEIESRKSLLNLDKFAHPFDYTLELAVDSSGATKPQKVDMVETFNFLVGLRVGLIDRHIDKGYVLVQGDLPNGEEALVLWRDLGKINNDELKKILDKQAIHPREKGFVLYVNGDHNLPNTVKEEGEEKTIKVRSIEADFTRLMFEEA